MQLERSVRPGGVEHARRVVALIRPEHGPVVQDLRVPHVDLNGRVRDIRDDADAGLKGNRCSSRPVRRDVQRHLARKPDARPSPVLESDHRAVPGDLLATQQRAQREAKQAREGGSKVAWEDRHPVIKVPQMQGLRLIHILMRGVTTDRKPKLEHPVSNQG